MNKILLIFCAISLFGCNPPPTNYKAPEEEADIKTNLFYFRDKYNYCYTALTNKTTHNYKVTTITIVPCQPDIK